MRITNLETFVCTYVFPDEHRWWSGDWTSLKRGVRFNGLFVRVHTDEGISGIGEPMCRQRHLEPTRRALEEMVKPRLLGQDPFQIEKLTVWGNDRYVNWGLAAVDSALWDIAGKATGTPVYRLLDHEGVAQTRLRAYASGGVAYEWWGNPETLLDEVRAHKDAGFSAMKFRIGTPWGISAVTVARFVELLRKVRQTAGDDFDLMLDANLRFTDYAMALAVARELRDLNFRWFEDPLHDPTPEDLRRLRQDSGMVISGGETVMDLGRLRRFIDGGAYDALHIDANWLGLTQARRVAGWARTRGLRCIPHCWTTAVALSVNAHLVAALSNRDLLEYQAIHNRLLTDVVDAPLKPKNGYVTVPERPGLGIELNLAALKRYPYQGTGDYEDWPAPQGSMVG